MKLSSLLTFTSLFVRLVSTMPLLGMEKSSNGTLEKFITGINDVLSIPRRDIERGYVRKDGTYKDPDEFFQTIKVNFLKNSTEIEKDFANGSKNAEIDINEKNKEKFQGHLYDSIEEETVEDGSKFKPFQPPAINEPKDELEPNEFTDDLGAKENSEFDESLPNENSDSLAAKSYARAQRKKRETNVIPFSLSHVHLRSYKQVNGFWNKLQSTVKTNLLIGHLYW